MRSLELGLKIVAFIKGCGTFLAYGWWDRSYLGPVGSLYWLSPGFALFLLAFIPFRFLSSRLFTRWAITTLCTVAAVKLVQGIIGSVNSPIEPDTAAIIFRCLDIAILILSLRVIWWPIDGNDRKAWGQEQRSDYNSQAKASDLNH